MMNWDIPELSAKQDIPMKYIWLKKNKKKNCINTKFQICVTKKMYVPVNFHLMLFGLNRIHLLQLDAPDPLNGFIIIVISVQQLMSITNLHNC